jgi:hypothetical protein
MPTCKGDREGNREIERAGKIKVTTGGRRAYASMGKLLVLLVSRPKNSS